MMNLTEFVTESNRIEGIHRACPHEVEALEAFLNSKASMSDLIKLVGEFEPDAELRNKFGMNVRVGKYKPPLGGPHIIEKLQNILQDVKHKDPFLTHLKYEALHPFTDCNGRSGRALWLWQMLKLNRKISAGGFLHTFYYQTLSELDPP